VRDGGDGTIVSRGWFGQKDFLPVASAIAPDFGASPAPDVVVAAWRPADGQNRLDARDAGTGDKVKIHSWGGSWQPIDVATAPNFGGTTASEAVILQRRLSDGKQQLWVRDLKTGDTLIRITVPKRYVPVEILVVPNFADSPAPEVGVVTVKPGTGEVGIQYYDLGTGAMVGETRFGAGLVPIGAGLLADTTGGGVPEIALWGWDLGADEIRVLVEDPATGAGRVEHLITKSALPYGFLPMGNFGGTLSDELVTLFQKSGQEAKATVRDGGDGLFLKGHKLPLAFYPLGLITLPNYGDTPADEVGLFGVRLSDGEKRVFVIDGASGVNVIRTRNSIPVP